MSLIEVKSPDGSESKKFVNVDKLITALTNHQIPFHPVIENVDFSGKSFEQNEDDIAAADERSMMGLEALLNNPEIRNRPIDEVLKEFQTMTQTPQSEVVEATFKNCKFDETNFFCEMNINAEDCSFKKAYVEFSPLSIKGKNNNFEGLSSNEGDLALDVENCSFKGADLYKSHISGKLKNCNFDIEWDRVWLGQYNYLTMENVDFGAKEINPDYFSSDNLTLKNPKINAETLAGIQQTNPDCLNRNIPFASRPAHEM